MKIYLTDHQVEELVSNNLYNYEGNIYKARCFSADYSNNLNLPALSLPGGDIGELAILIAASRIYGFDLDLSKGLDILLDVIGGKKNSTFNTLNEHTLELCYYVNSLIENSIEYGLDDRGKNDLLTMLKTLGLPKRFKPLQKRDHENACIIFEAEQGLFPNYTYDSGYGVVNAKILVFHKSFVDRRHRELCKLWYENKAVELFSGLDADYLYEIISEMTETHLFQTMKLRDPKIPLYSVSVTPNNKINVTSF